MTQRKYVSLSKLSTFLDNLKDTFAVLGHKHKVSDFEDFTIDTELSSTSTNAVQNKVIEAEFEAVSKAMLALDAAIDGKADATQLDAKSDTTHNHDSAYDTKGSASSALNSAKEYADNAVNTVKNDLLNNAGDAYDTLKELGDLINENTDAIDALETIAVNKVDSVNGKKGEIVLTASEIGALSYDSAQSLTVTQKNQAMANIGVFISDTEPTNMAVGELWLDTSIVVMPSAEEIVF